ncbi:hypothetical protein [Rhodococcus sp. 06-1474-1B]|uniref:hypothetical protein n=1 Tax=Rhodococcus sp. 06-1474-1B TaxID=2022499 RepID=UPI00113FE9C1|nr:hypothetical protein [Rhodococcus sp. 06-1474-1B]
MIKDDVFNSKLGVLAITLGGRKVASSRVRAHEPLALACSRGIKTKVIEVHGNRLWPISLVAWLIFRRPRILVIQKVLPPIWLTGIIRWVARDLRVELDDAVYFGYPGASEQKLSQSVNRSRRLFQAADRVVVTTPTIAADIQRIAGVQAWPFAGPAPSGPLAEFASKPGILWLGSPSTIANVEPLIPALSSWVAGKSGGPELLWIVGAVADASTDAPVRVRRWSPEVERTALAECSIGLMPLTDDVWNRRKAAFKVLVYLANGVIPVVPDVPAVRALLGDQLNELCVEVANPSRPQSWVDAVGSAWSVPVGGAWVDARDRLFANLSVDNYLNVLLGDTLEKHGMTGK